jgi:chromosome segregation ATPase
MSDNPTQEIPDSRSFEERVFARFDALDGRLDRFESRIEAKVDALDSRLSSVENKVDGLDGRLMTLEEKVDSRLRETRPIWEAVLARLTSVEERTGSLESEVRKVRRIMKSLHEDALSTRAEHAGLEDDFEKLDERVEKLESQSPR